MLDGLLERICGVGDRPYVNIERALFDASFTAEDFRQSIVDNFKDVGIVYGVFRSYIDIFESAPFRDVRWLFLIWIDEMPSFRTITPQGGAITFLPLGRYAIHC